jgi:hypothetical protein
MVVARVGVASTAAKLTAATIWRARERIVKILSRIVKMS